MQGPASSPSSTPDPNTAFVQLIRLPGRFKGHVSYGMHLSTASIRLQGWLFSVRRVKFRGSQPNTKAKLRDQKGRESVDSGKGNFPS